MKKVIPLHKHVIIGREIKANREMFFDLLSTSQSNQLSKAIVAQIKSLNSLRSILEELMFNNYPDLDSNYTHVYYGESFPQESFNTLHKNSTKTC
jgi:hypothetical protein